MGLVIIDCERVAMVVFVAFDILEVSEDILKVLKGMEGKLRERENGWVGVCGGSEVIEKLGWRVFLW